MSNVSGCRVRRKGPMVASMRRASRTQRAAFAVAGVVVTVTALTTRCFADIQYSVTDLGTLSGGGNSWATGINDSGQVVGYAMASSGSYHAFLYSNGKMTDLGTLGGPRSSAVGINDSGQVVGSADTDYFHQSSFLYSNGNMVNLHVSYGSGFSPFAINNNGQMAGVGNVNSSFHAIIYNYNNGNIVDLGPSSAAYAINNNNQVVGAAKVSSGNYHAFLYSNGKMTDLGTPGGPGSIATGINDSGQVVGYANTSSSADDRSFLYSNGNMVDLGMLPGGSNCWARGINDSGQVVGEANTTNPPTYPGSVSSHAFLYSNGKITDLNTLTSGSGWLLTDARAINANGQIICDGAQGILYHAVLLTPTVTTQAVNRMPATTLTTVYTPPPEQIVTLQNNTVQVSNTDPNQQGLLVYSNGQFSTSGTINRTDPTIVLTHGFTSDPSMWNQFAQQYPSGVNIVAWNWSEDASLLSGLGFATSRTDLEGTALGKSLVTALGASYNGDIHFFGHSLGNLVNASAVNLFEAQTHDNTKTQVTIFDDAEIANEFPATGHFTSSIPTALVAQIDNYISAFGTTHDLPYVSNIILDYSQSPTFLGLHNDVLFHGYPPDWYRSTLPQNSMGSGVGYAWAIDNGAAAAFPAGEYFQQVSAPGNPLDLSKISSADATTLIATRDNSIQENLLGNTLAATDLVSSTIQTVGNVSANLENSTLHLVLGGLLPIAPKLEASSDVVTAGTTPSPSYAWVQVHIPNDTEDMSFDFTFNGADPSDLLFVGINDTQLFALEGAYVPDGTVENSGLLNISAWSGQDVELFVGDTGISANGTMTVTNITFESVPEPTSLSVMALGILLLSRRYRQSWVSSKSPTKEES